MLQGHSSLVRLAECGLPARQRTAVSFLLEPALVLDRSNVRAGWYILHSSSDMKPAVQLFPWDPGGHTCSPNLFYILVPNLFHILVLNNKGKPRCKSLNLRSCHVSLRQLVGELLRNGGEMSCGRRRARHADHASRTSRKGKEQSAPRIGGSGLRLEGKESWSPCMLIRRVARRQALIRLVARRKGEPVMALDSGSLAPIMSGRVAYLYL
jgi:hypothetical protein